MENTAERKNLETQIQDMQQQIDILEKRRSDLIDERSKVNGVIASKARSLGDAVISGKDAKKEYDAMMLEKQRLDSFDAAIAQANSKLEQQQEDITSSKQKLSALFYHQEAKEFESLVLDYVRLFIALGQSFQMLEAKHREIVKLADYGDIAQTPAGLSRAVHTFTMLNMEWNGRIPNGALAKIESLQRSSPEVIDQARKRK